MGKVVLGMTMSLDGFINDRDGSVEALYPDLVALRDNEPLKESIQNTGAVVMGRNSFAMAEDPDSIIESSMGYLTTSLDPAHAFTFGSGVGLYLMGTTIFRKVSGIPEVTYRYIAACLAVLTGFIGNNFYAGLQFACLILTVLILAKSNWTLTKQFE
jgi:hypothetical protein